MIYLIDDSSLQHLNAEYVLQDKYKDVLCNIRDAELFESKQSEIAAAECIMIHRTFANSQKAKEQMAELTDDGNKIPFVVFSAGDSEHAVYNAENPNAIEGLKKSVFYGRLKSFLDNYLQTKVLDMQILAYGKDYIRINVRAWAVQVMHLTVGKTGILETNDISKIAACPAFKKIISASCPAIGFSYDDLLEKLEDEPTTFETFRMNITNIVNSFNQYGKNIYSWK